MTKGSRKDLKELFKNGLKPNEDHFGQLIDSFIHPMDDNIFPLDNKIGIGTISPNALLHIDASQRKRGFSEEGRDTIYLMIGNPEDAHVIISPRGMVARNGEKETELILNDGGDLNVKGSIVRFSDASLKQEIKPLHLGLKEINALKPISFRWNDDKSIVPDIKYGFIAQEMEEIIPDVVYTNSTSGIKGISEIELVPILVKSIQEQQEQINALNERIEKLEKLMQNK
jgi:hypothetical protein